MGKQQKRNNGVEERGGNLVPVLIMLATVLALAVPMFCLNAANPVNRFNVHLNKAVRIYETAHGSGVGDGVADPVRDAAAKQEFLTALACGERAFGHDDERLEGVLTILQQYAVRDRNWEQARAYGERLLDMQQKLYGPTDERLIETYNALGRAYRESGDFLAEERALKQIAKISADVLGSRELAAFYGRHQRYAEALPLYRQLVSALIVETAKRKATKASEQYGQALKLTSITLKEYSKILQATGKTSEYRTAVDLEKKIEGDLREQQRTAKLKAPAKKAK